MSQHELQIERCGFRCFRVGSRRRPDETGFQRPGVKPLAVVIGDPRPAEVMQERPAVVGECNLLFEVERLDRGIITFTVSVPVSQQPGNRDELRMQIIGNRKGHDASLTSRGISGSYATGMRAVIQRASRADITVDNEVVASIGSGLVVFLGVTHDDTRPAAARMAAKIFRMRILPGEESCEQSGAPLMVVSQFTLYGDARKGRRPSWTAAAPGSVAEPLYAQFCHELESLGATVAPGVFGAQMQVSIVNDGPFTLTLEG